MFTEYESFRHGLILSKIWLCEELEKVSLTLNYVKPSVHILAAWDNLLSFMMIIRKPYSYKDFFGYDINPKFTEASNKICNTWLYDETYTFDDPRIKNITADVNLYNGYTLSSDNIFINCSVDQIEGTSWYDNIPDGSLVCLQTTDIVDTEHPWYIRTITTDIDQFKIKFPMASMYYEGAKNISYGNWGYNRLMLIGIK